MFTDKELRNKALWGLSSIEQGIEFFQKAAIKNMLITHHDPSRTDDQLNVCLKNYLRESYLQKMG